MRAVGLPVIVDLCCGDGGFAEGAIRAGAFVGGVDIARYPGLAALEATGKFEFLEVDLLAVSLASLQIYKPVLVFSGAPCEEAARHKMPWTRAKNPPLPDLSLINASRRVAAVCGCPFILEN